jgi:hypothetical protein
VAIGGVILLLASTWIWWSAASGLITALFDGNPAEVLLGLYVVVPFALALLFSIVGLIGEMVAAPSAAQPHANSSELDGQAAGGLPCHLLLLVRIRLNVTAIGHM